MLAADGRVIGARAQHTRRRLLDTTARLLDERGVMELKVVDVTREVGTSPATFYQYFADVDAAILALADEATEDERPLVDHLRPDWTAAGRARPRAREFVDAYMKFWDEHHAVLRIRNLKAEEGDTPVPRRPSDRQRVHGRGDGRLGARRARPPGGCRSRSTRSAPARRWSR